MRVRRRGCQGHAEGQRGAGNQAWREARVMREGAGASRLHCRRDHRSARHGGTPGPRRRRSNARTSTVPPTATSRPPASRSASRRFHSRFSLTCASGAPNKEARRGGHTPRFPRPPLPCACLPSLIFSAGSTPGFHRHRPPNGAGSHPLGITGEKGKENIEPESIAQPANYVRGPFV